MSVTITKYLARQAEPEARAAGAIHGSFGDAVVVPAYGEEQSLFDTLGSVPRASSGETLIVVVLNARADSPPEVHRANASATVRGVRSSVRRRRPPANGCRGPGIRTRTGTRLTPPGRDFASGASPAVPPPPP